MPLVTPPKIEPLCTHHDRAAFFCGESALDKYIQKQASQDVRRRIAQVFVAVGNEPHVIAGYYSLSATSFSKEDLPRKIAKKLPHYPVPAAIIGRLAVDKAYQGQQLGKFMLFDAFRRVLQASSTMAVFAIVVDAKTDHAKAFYEKWGFLPFPELSKRLFLPLKTLADAWDSDH